MIHEQVGRKIKQLRIREGMTLEQLGERLGVTKGYVHHMENGNRKISLDFLQSIADVFNVGMYYFFTDRKLVELDDETIALFNLNNELKEEEISIDDIRMYVEIAKTRRKK